jgi:hypothetical protein
MERYMRPEDEEEDVSSLMEEKRYRKLREKVLDPILGSSL